MGEQADYAAALVTAFTGAISAALTAYGPGTVLLIIGIVVLLIRHEKLWAQRLEEKIKR